MIKTIFNSSLSVVAVLSIAVGCADSDRKTPIRLGDRSAATPPQTKLTKETIDVLGDFGERAEIQESEIDKIVDSLKLNGQPTVVENLEGEFELKRIVKVVEDTNPNIKGFKIALIHNVEDIKSFVSEGPSCGGPDKDRRWVYANDLNLDEADQVRAESTLNIPTRIVAKSKDTSVFTDRMSDFVSYSVETSDLIDCQIVNQTATKDVSVDSFNPLNGVANGEKIYAATQNDEAVELQVQKKGFNQIMIQLVTESQESKVKTETLLIYAKKSEGLIDNSSARDAKRTELGKRSDKRLESGARSRK